MQLGDLLASGALFVPWPMSCQGRIIDSQAMQVSPVCNRKCATGPQCAMAQVPIGEHVCEFGLSYFRVCIDDVDITIYGVRGPRNPHLAHSRFKEMLKGRTVTPEQVRDWSAGIRRLTDSMKAEFLQRQSELLDPLHDPMRLSGQIESLAMLLVAKENPDLRFDAQIEAASYEAKSIVRASRLLAESFELLTIYFNPDAASFGRKVKIQVHGLLRKLQAIFSIRDTAEKRAPRIYLDGHSYRDIEVYESFKALPFALINNAVKYSLVGDIRIRLSENEDALEVSIESTGPYVEPFERDAIFERRKRGKWATNLVEGTGVGLYLAKIVAAANSCQLIVSSERLQDREVNGIPLALNRFTFTVPFP